MSATLRRRLLIVVALAAVAPAALTVLYSYPPAEYRFYPGCLFHSVTGLHCPGCGATRSSYALLHGDIPQALAHNPLFVLALPLLALVGLRLLVATWTGRTTRRVPTWCLYAILGIVVAFWVLRNLDVYPLNLLAPHSL
jgi:hypothetical protein